MGLAYCSRSWGRWDSDICETHEYCEAHKWGTSGGLRGIVDGSVRIFSSFYSGRFGWLRSKFNLAFLREDEDPRSEGRAYPLVVFFLFFCFCNHV